MPIRRVRVCAIFSICLVAIFPGTPQLAAQEAGLPAPVPQPVAQADQGQAQVNQAMQQRLLGLVPNFFVVYTPHPIPLTSKQKFKLAFRSAVDPMAFAGAGVSGAFGQLQNDPKSFGQGARGYFERVGASYGASQFGNITGNAIVPSILKQDPRYFYKGTGSVRSRFFYAASNSFICMGDNGHWQVNVSQTVGSLAAAGITELEYPPSDRFGIGRVFKDFIISKAAAGAENVFQEFFSRRLTFRLNSHQRPNP
ncbi:MAG TPA: hypothetical protein VGJ21_23600 [Terracidiphilus sp.]|jgi:hypothetical protein